MGATMNRNTEPIPGWIMAFGGLLVLVGLMAGAMQYLQPAAAFPGLVVDSAAIQAAAAHAGSRSVAQAIVLGLALVFRARQALGYLFIMRALTEIQDLLISLTTGVMPVPAPPAVVAVIFLALFIIPETLAAITLLRRPRATDVPALS
jgi:hypothetical protein